MPRDTNYAACAYCGARLHIITKSNLDMHWLCVKWRRRHEMKCSVRSPLERGIWALKYTSNPATANGITVDLSHPGFYFDAGALNDEVDEIDALASLIC